MTEYQMKIFKIADRIQKRISPTRDINVEYYGHMYQRYRIAGAKLKWPNADMVVGQRPTAEMRMYNYLCCGYGMWYSCTRRGVHDFLKLFTMEQLDDMLKAIQRGPLDYPDGYLNSDTTLLEDINPLAHHAAFKFGIMPFPKHVLTDEEQKTLADIVDVMYFRWVVDISHVTAFNLMFCGPHPKLDREIIGSHLFDGVLKQGITKIDFTLSKDNLAPWNADGELLTIKPTK